MLLGLLLAPLARAEKSQAKLKFVVLKEHNGKPVRNASVVLHRSEERRVGKECRL